METVDTDLQSVRERLQNRLIEVERQLGPLQAEAAKVKTQLEFVERALGVDEATAPTMAKQARSGPRRSINELVEKILVEAAQPLHISEIRKRFVAAGHEIPGQGKESNLLIYMVRDPRFVRVAKGTYGLAVSGLVAAPRRRKRRRKRTKKT